MVAANKLTLVRVQLFLALAMLAQPVAADTPKKYALMIGGSGEESETSNFFKPGFVTYRNNLTDRGWNVTTLFNGSKFWLRNSKTATNDNISSALQKIQQSAQQGDQVLLYVNAHGRKSDPVNSPGHTICTEDDEGFSTAKMQELAQELSKKGVKVALIDLSCYSGSTQDTKNGASSQDYCIGTLASRNYVSVCGMTPQGTLGFTNTFVDLPKGSPSVSVEEKFLQARAKDESVVDLAEISSFSTPLRAQWDKFLSELDPDDVDRKMGSQKRRSSKVNEHIGKGDEEIEPDVDDSLVRIFNARDELLKGYKKIFSELSADRKKSLRPAWESIQESFSTLNPSLTKTDGLFWKINDLFRKPQNWGPDIPDWSALQMDVVLKILESKDDLKKFQWMDDEDRENVSKVKSKLEEVKKKYDAITGGVRSDWELYKEEKAKLIKNIRQLMISERAFYKEYYDLHQKKGANPCKDFLL